MATVIARLSVEDFDGWFVEYEHMHPVRAAQGERGHVLYRDPEDPHAVIVIFEWDDLAHARSYFGSPELAASVSRAQGRAAPAVWYLEPA